jgi:ATP-binding cassette subfamily F protein 3
MLQANNISHYYGDRALFKRVNFNIYDKEKIGLIGKNGTGKTTLFNIIANNINSTEGKIEIPSLYKIGMLAQFFTGSNEKTVREESKSVYEQYFANQKELIDLENQLQNGAEDLSILERIDTLNTYFTTYNINPEAEIEKILLGLGFLPTDLDRKMKEFSGGWKMRVEIAKLLLSNNDLILLDEPTNHLDIEAIIWFEKFLEQYPKSYILISHDKRFLDNTITKVYELENNKLSIYTGNYSKYLVEKKEREDILRETAKNQHKRLDEKQKLVDRFRAKASKAKMAQSLEKQIQKEERIEFEESNDGGLRMRFPPVTRTGRDVAKIEKLTKSYGDHTVLSQVSLLIERGDKVAFVGQNGMGKTTLLKIIANELSYNDGNYSGGAQVNINYFAQDQADTLDPKKTVLETIEDASEEKYRLKVRGILGSFLFSGEDVDKKVSVLSGGERTRLALACMIVRDSNFIILDEPTNHLDLHSKAILKDAIRNYEGTILVVSHDRDFLTHLSTKTFEFRDGKVIEYLGDIDYLLEKRGMDFRDMQLVQKEDIVEESAETKKEKWEQRKKLQRKVANAEKKIEKLEAEIVDLKTKLMDPAVYENSEGIELGKKLKAKQTEISYLMMEWEEASEEFEKLEA